MFDMIDNIIVEDSAYDADHNGQIIKIRASINKEYGRIGITISDEYRSGNAPVNGGSIDAASGSDNFAGLQPKN